MYRAQIFTRVFRCRFPYSSHYVVTQTIRYLDIKNLTQIFGFSSFVVFLVIVMFLSDFILFFFVISCFCFLIKIIFLVYLRFYKPLTEVDFTIIIFKETNPMNLKFISISIISFVHQNYVFFFFNLTWVFESACGHLD